MIQEPHNNTSKSRYKGFFIRASSSISQLLADSPQKANCHEYIHFYVFLIHHDDLTYHDKKNKEKKYRVYQKNLVSLHIGGF